MLISPQRAQVNLDAALAQIRIKTRMRLGIVVGILIVGVLRTDFAAPLVAVAMPALPPVIAALFPLAAIAVAGVAGIFALRQRDIRRARAAFDKTAFKIPTRKSPKA